MFKKAVVIVMCLLLVSVSASGSGILVLDIAAVAQAVQLVSQAVNTYHLASQQARYIVGAGGYKTAWKRWIPAGAPDTYNRNSGFLRNVNGMLGAVQTSLRRFPDYGLVIQNFSGPTQDRVKWQYGMAELHDGVTQHMLDISGQINANDQTTNLNNLDGLVFSGAAGDNSAVMEAHKGAMSSAIVAHQNEDIKRLLAVGVEQQGLVLKVQRDAMEQSMSEHVERITRAPETMRDVAGASAKINAFVF